MLGLGSGTTRTSHTLLKKCLPSFAQFEGIRTKFRSNAPVSNTVTMLLLKSKVMLGKRKRATLLDVAQELQLLILAQCDDTTMGRLEQVCKRFRAPQQPTRSATRVTTAELENCSDLGDILKLADAMMLGLSGLCSVGQLVPTSTMLVPC